MHDNNNHFVIITLALARRAPIQGIFIWIFAMRACNVLLWRSNKRQVNQIITQASYICLFCFVAAAVAVVVISQQTGPFIHCALQISTRYHVKWSATKQNIPNASQSLWRFALALNRDKSFYFFNFNCIWVLQFFFFLKLNLLMEWNCICHWPLTSCNLTELKFHQRKSKVKICGKKHLIWFKKTAKQFQHVIQSFRLFWLLFFVMNRQTKKKERRRQITDVQWRKKKKRMKKV